MKAFRILWPWNKPSGNILGNKLIQENVRWENVTAKPMSTVDQKDIDRMSGWKNSWWNEDGVLKPLHAFNGLRMELIRNGLANVGFESHNPALPLEGFKIADIGCGGGILTENLARAGARVTGIDAAADLIDVAKEHVKLDHVIANRVEYVCTTVEELSQTEAESYDVIVASEVVEHVSNPEFFLKECVKILKPNGSIFLTTPNRTAASWLNTIVIAEYLTNYIPRGTHEWNKFVAPHEIQRILEQHGCKTKLIHGIIFNPFSCNWFWTSYTTVHYALHAVKQGKINSHN